MNLLLDSHVLLWALHAPEKLNPPAKAAIEDPENTIFFSAGAVWEIELKASRGKIDLPEGWLESAHLTGFQELPITAEDGRASAHLPWLHQDPFDRLFIAQAVSRGWRLASRDAVIQRYNVEVFPA